MIHGYKFWMTFRVVIHRRGFDSGSNLLPRAFSFFETILGGGRNVLLCG